VRIGVTEDPARGIFRFRPADLSASVGDTVDFVNDGKEVHTVVSPGLFESPSVLPGATFSVTLRQAGDVSYVCTLHADMNGVIHVRAAGAASAAEAGPDFGVPGGWFYTQTGGGGGKGYAVTDEGGVRFWSELQRLGGVQAVGYPASQRFQWDGFTVQVFQRVIFQWRPESNGVAFVNVFDRLHDLGKDDWLRQVRQTPPPRAFDDAGKPFDQVAANHLAVLAPFPAIRAAYMGAAGDPIQANGLPVSDVSDTGDAFVLRAQRVVLQQWKKDVPWAKAGEVTVALGGDIAKEAGILPDASALQPRLPGEAPPPAAAPTAPVARPAPPRPAAPPRSGY
jgi:hypothetical protein